MVRIEVSVLICFVSHYFGPRVNEQHWEFMTCHYSALTLFKWKIVFHLNNAYSA